MKRNKNWKGSFAGIPRVVIDHADYASLDGNAVKLLVDLAYQFRGHNNGDLTTAVSVLSKRGWRSRQTIDRAKHQLLEYDFIVETRQGRFSNPGGQCALYALTWKPIDECPDKRLTVGPTSRPPRSFMPGVDVPRLTAKLAQATP